MPSAHQPLALPCAAACSALQILAGAFFAAWTAVTSAWICGAERIAILHEMLRHASWCCSMLFRGWQAGG